MIKISALSMAIALCQSCVASPSDGRFEPNGYDMLPERCVTIMRGTDGWIPPISNRCEPGREMVLISYSVEPVDGGCRAGEMEMRGYRDVVGCIVDRRKWVLDSVEVER